MIALFLGCTFEAGQGFGRLDAVAFSAAYQPGEARDLGGGLTLTNLGYQVRLDLFQIEGATVELLAISGGGSTTFDPANPPEGYTLCHSGECHSDAGAIVEYADVEADLAGGESAFSAVVNLAVDGSIDLLAGVDVALVNPEPTLGTADISKLVVSVGTASLSGAIVAEDGGETPFSATMPLDADLGISLDLPLDRDHDPVIVLEVGLFPAGDLFDDLDFTALAVDGSVVINGAESAGGETLLAALLAIEPAPTVTRFPQ